MLGAGLFTGKNCCKKLRDHFLRAPSSQPGLVLGVRAPSAVAGANGHDAAVHRRPEAADIVVVDDSCTRAAKFFAVRIMNSEAVDVPAQAFTSHQNVNDRLFQRIGAAPATGRTSEGSFFPSGRVPWSAPASRWTPPGPSYRSGCGRWRWQRSGDRPA